MDLPAEMQITVHYASDDTVNAMATLGGNIVVFQGLIDTVDSENALAMVLAHEIAHVRHRHPIVAMGRGFTVMLALSALSGVGDGMIQQWVGSMGMLPMLAFSREQEEAADAARCKPCSASTATPTVLRPSSSAYRRNLPCRNRPRS